MHGEILRIDYHTMTTSTAVQHGVRCVLGPFELFPLQRYPVSLCVGCAKPLLGWHPLPWRYLLSLNQPLKLDVTMTRGRGTPLLEWSDLLSARAQRFWSLGDVRRFEVLSSTMRHRLHVDPWAVATSGTQRFLPSLDATRARVTSL